MYAHHLAGRRYKIGYDSRVLGSPPHIGITSIHPKMETTAGDLYPIHHYFKRKFERGATSQEVLETVRNPVIALHQWGGQRTVFVTPQMTVVMTSGGALVTVWTASEYDAGMQKLLADAGY